MAEGNVNAAVELHDSLVVVVDSIAGVVTVRLRAYVHRSNGRPGFDPGSGYKIRVRNRARAMIFHSLFTSHCKSILYIFPSTNSPYKS